MCYVLLCTACGLNNPCEILAIALLYEQSLTRTRMSFFDTTPLGHITNWFITDMLKMDSLLVNGMTQILVQIFP